VRRDTSGLARTTAANAWFASREGDAAWSEFLVVYSPLILQVVRLFERDADTVQDCFLFVCERLRRNNLQRIRRFREDGAASFPTWLRTVVRRLCLDWRRHSYGRFRLPRAIARLPELEQEVFRCLHVRHLSENEALHCLTALWPGLTRQQLADAAARVGGSLPPRQWWLLLVHRPRLQSISKAPDGTDPADGESGLVDPAVDPEHEAADREQVAALRAAIDRLEPRARLLVRLRYVEELPLAEIARLAGLSGASQVERLLQRALDELRATMGVESPAGVSVEEG
jgi:RNA polymerase sigma factor (sigma-70 family)